MNRAALVACLFACGLSVAAQEKKESKLAASNEKMGVSILAPPSPGKDQLWEAKEEGSFFKDSAVSVSHKVDLFTVEVLVQRKENKDPMREGWKKPAEIAKDIRAAYTAKEGDKEPNFKECILNNEDPKAKLSSIPGAACSHKITLVDKTGGKHQLLEYFIISSDVYYRVVVKYTDDSYKKYWAKEGQFILNSIKRFGPKK
ncbi:MAG TPA: hypothetical protein VGK61_08130 [Planctomycetota bacterium]|jgi:hypothetical protein